MSEEGAIVVTATRYDVARIRIVRVLAPVTMIVGVSARWTMAKPLVLAAFALILFTIGMYASSRAALRRRAMHVCDGVIRLRADSAAWRPSAHPRHDPSDDIALAAIRQWTWNGSIVRLYGGEHAWKLCSASGHHEALGHALRAGLGPPLLLRRRGSARARVLALAIAAVGGAALWAGIAYEWSALALVGVPCVIGGLAALGALSQSVTR
jgi:hypothetical protein